MKKFAVTLVAAALGLFSLTVVIYWFNLDSKLVKALEKPLMQHYDNMERDRRL